MSLADKKKGRRLYIILVSVHGLMRGKDIELGRDADTGGQIKYVLEQAQALIAHRDVERVDILTRQVIDSKVADSYSEPQEELADGLRIIRLPCGPRRYLRKEVLWPYLDSFADQALKHIRQVGRIPDIIHGHYADAGYVGRRLCSLLEVPLVFTGHSLGRVKLQRLLANGQTPAAIERQYHISQRIEAEESALDLAVQVIASTHQEIEEQYLLYDNYQPKRMAVIPPGIDLGRFYPPRRGRFQPAIFQQIARFLDDPGKPMILALSRADPRKNIATLVEAYARSPALQEKANLVLVAGNRDDIRALDKGARTVMTELLLAIDRHDLYGRVAIPKHHEPRDVPYLYRLAAKSKGVFVNPALTEPFGLTLLEAAASGLPMVATEDGGPRDIVDFCRNGLLVDPLDADAMAAALLDALSNKARWQRWSKAGLSGVQKHFSWPGHVNHYLREITRLLPKHSRRRPRRGLRNARGRLATADRILVCDLNNTLLGDEAALMRLLRLLNEAGERVAFGIVTGQRVGCALAQLERKRVPMPSFLITATGTEIHYGSQLVVDDGWARTIDYRWEPEKVRQVMATIPGITAQAEHEQTPSKLSYLLDEIDNPPLVARLRKTLRQNDLQVTVVCAHGKYLDILPVRASKGAALRYLADKWGIPVEHILACGDSGNDDEMLSGETLGVVVGNHEAELEYLRGRERVYFAEGAFAAGILEGIDHYDFFGHPGDPEEEEKA